MFRDEIMSQMNDAISKIPSTDPAVIEGFKAVYTASAEKLLTTNSGQVELLLSLTGSSLASDALTVQAALQRPFRYVLV